jgi:hypothetical protein
MYTSMENNIPIEELYSQPVVQELLDKVNSNSEEQDLENLKIPYVIKEKILMSPGIWNNYYYSPKAIREAFLKTRWDDKQVRSLFLDHLDQSTKEWIGEVKNPKMKGDNLVGDLVVVDKPTAQKLAYGAKMGISPKVHGEQEDNKMLSFLYDNFSVVINPAVKTAYINNMEVKNMAEEQTKAPVQEEPVKKMEEEPKTEEPKVEQPKEPVENTETKTEEAKMSETDELLSAMEEVENQGNVAAIVKKAKEIRKEGESWRDAMKRASAEMAEEEPKAEEPKKEPKEEEPAKEEPAEMAQEDVVNQILKLAKLLEEDKKKKYPEPEPKEDDKKEDEEEDKMNEETVKMKETINELSEKVTALTKKLNEPDKVSEKGEHILSEEEQIEQVSQNLDEAFLKVLNDS